ncbi:MAG: metallophosphoesterase [Polyangiales bacterium]
MDFVRLVLSDLHLGTGVRRGRLNPLEDFFFDDRFAELLAHYDAQMGDRGEVELILNGDIFDLLKVKVGGKWPTRISPDIACAKLQQCLEGHPRFVRALRDFLSRPGRRLTYLPGNHDLDMWFAAPQALFKRHVAPGDAAARVRFITESDTYYLPEGIQIRHGHQLEHIHRVDYRRMTRRDRRGHEVLNLPWGSLWILEVMNPAKEMRHHIDRIQPLGRFLLGALLFDPAFVIRFAMATTMHFLRRRMLAFRAWRQRLRNLPRLLREELVALGSFDAAAIASIERVRGAHTLIVGHSHGPRYIHLESGKTLVNTGTWMKMVNLDIKYLGQDSGLTYALIEYDADKQAQTRLMRWHGIRRVCEAIPHAD